MLKIFICEDDNDQRATLATVVKNYLMMMDVDATLELSTHNPDDLLSWNTSENHDFLFFLDIELNHQTNGVVLASKLRNIYPHAKIVFITSHTEMAFLSFFYKVEALDFIQKTSYEELKLKVIDALNTTLARIKIPLPSQKEFILIRNNYTDIKLVVDDIMFFITTQTPHKINVHLINRQSEFYSSIKDISSYNDAFFRCHQSTVVNVNNIASVDRKNRTIHMIDGETCKVSVRYLKGLLDKLQQRKQEKSEHLCSHT